MKDSGLRFGVAALAAVMLWPAVQSSASDTATAAKTAAAKKASAKATATKTSTVKSSASKAGAKGSTKTSSAKSPARGPVKSAVAGRAMAMKATAQSMHLTSAFLASEQLRPMAQQLAAMRSAPAFAGVASYAHTHPGEGAAAAYLALGHASMMDKKFAEALTSFRQANTSGDALDDYADYLGAQAAVQAGRPTEAYALLDRFADRHPDSIFVATAPVLLANAYLQQSDAQGALKVLTPLVGSPVATRADFQLALGKAYKSAGDMTHAATVFRTLYKALPLSSEAGQVPAQMQQMSSPLTAAERKTHADALFNAKRYNDANTEYNAIGKNNQELSAADRNGLEIYSAVCEFKLKHITRRDVERLPETSDDTAALKLYMLSELSRSENDETGHDALIAQMVEKYPTSRWLEEALYSSGNMYLLKHNAAHAITNYTKLVQLFPKSTYTPSAHWRAAWMNYRLRNYPEAARLMDEQIERYAAGIEAPTALYWRGRLYEDQEHNFPQAENYYRALTDGYTNYYYAGLARQRLTVLGPQAAVEPTAAVRAVAKAHVPDLTDELPENDVHLIKARLLANAALNEYIGPEIDASPDSSQWGALAQAEIYSSYGEYTRALQSMKKSGLSFFAMPMDEVPTMYWKLLFPQPYWTELVGNAGKNGLDPYLVASLIRQESEFNPGAVSSANAYGLMQLLPSVGRSWARKQGVKGFDARTLLNPATNLQLGTANLKAVLDRFGGQVEYALAAYNAGDTPVRQWLTTNDYKDVPEFVESIPYTETREYVQAILRNREMYKALYPVR